MTRTRAEKLVVLAKMRQDWRNVNDCIDDDLTELKVEWRFSPRDLFLMQTIQQTQQTNTFEQPSYGDCVITSSMALDRVKNRSVHTTAYSNYCNKQYAFKRARYEEAVRWGKEILTELSWLKAEIIRLEKELYYK